MSASKLPERPSLAYLRKLAKDRLEKLRHSDPQAKLAAALLDVAREHGFPSWRALKAEIEQHQTQAHKPDLNAPAMRSLAIRDIAASTAFYRDVLGFEIVEVDGATEAVLGPTRIRFGHGAPSIVFLQTADVESTHAAIRARGGTPSDIQKVNWIKMQMFEIRDPDRNVLWFGQTYHQGQESPSRRGSQPHGLWQALPELPFNDVPAAVAWYRDILGFRINYQQSDLGVMDRDAITILLIVRTADHKGIGSCEFYVADADAHYAEFTAKGAHTLGPPVSYPWGLRAFRVLDPEGNRLTFAQTFE
jgi:catechol 2,3-dioxygenase-like lactoylglutathione lyase family enzyme